MLAVPCQKPGPAGAAHRLSQLRTLALHKKQAQPVDAYVGADWRNLYPVDDWTDLRPAFLAPSGEGGVPGVAETNLSLVIPCSVLTDQTFPLPFACPAPFGWFQLLDALGVVRRVVGVTGPIAALRGACGVVPEAVAARLAGRDVPGPTITALATLLIG